MKVIISLIFSFLFIVVIGELYPCNNNKGEIEDSNIWTDTVPKEYLQLLKLQKGTAKYL